MVPPRRRLPLLLLLLAALLLLSHAYIAPLRQPTPPPLHGLHCRTTTPTMSALENNPTNRKAHLTGLASVLLGAAFGGGVPAVHAAGDDEYDVLFDATKPLGLALEDFGKGGKYRTYVAKLVRGSQAASKDIRIPALVVAVNGRNVEGLPRKLVVQLIRDAQEGRGGGNGSALRVTFRDPSKFMELLTEKGAEPGAAGGEGSEITTQLAPQTKAREAQTLSVKKTYIPEICNTGAKYGDLLEVKYATSLEDGTYLDSSGQSTPGRAGDVTLYFVLGQQVAGTVPKGWDLALVGACVGEKRRIRTPSVLAYGSKGLKARGIPPDATIIYDIEVIGIGGNNLPR